MWILSKWNFEIVNFVKNENLKLWILWKMWLFWEMRHRKCGLCRFINSLFWSLIFDKIHIFKVSFFHKFTISNSHFSQNSHFQIPRLTKFTFFKHQFLGNFWIKTWFCRYLPENQLASWASLAKSWSRNSNKSSKKLQAKMSKILIFPVRKGSKKKKNFRTAVQT